MVSSKCVSGLSTGSLEDSAITITKREMLNKIPGVDQPEDSILFRLKDRALKERANKTIDSTGSDRVEIIISLLEPIPPKLEPDSIPARAIKNLATPKQYINVIRS